MKTNTITTIRLEAEAGMLLIHKTDRFSHGRVIFCPVDSLNEYEELTETEVNEIVRKAEEERKEAELQAEQEALNDDNNSRTNN